MRRLRLAGLTVLGAAAGLIGRAGDRLGRALATVEVAGESMSPALLPGDFVLLRRGPPPRDARAFGRIVATRDAAGRLLLKRVTGLPGETLAPGASGELLIDGRALVEPYAGGLSTRWGRSDAPALAPLTLDEYFLLGDRRDASTDSRDFGPVSASRIEGVALLRYWPPARVAWLRRPSRRFAEAED